MRLTLRTLLAYLDNTLSPEDAATLREKLTESGQATGLVNRIRQTLSRSDLSAASPAAVDPIGDANVVAEYLDSTLPPEAVGEIEMATLKSDVQLAEVAACHQILTMVLGQSASVSEDLQRRVLDLPRTALASGGATAGGVAAPDPSPTIVPTNVVPTNGDAFNGDASVGDPTTGAPGLDIPPHDATNRDATGGHSPSGDPAMDELDAAASAAVTPLSKFDSGVASAATRLRGGVPGAASAKPAGPQAAVVRRDFDIDGTSPRWSRVMPYLVGLATLAVLLFALVQVFRPIIREAADDRDRVTLPSLPDDPDVTPSPRPMPSVQPDPAEMDPMGDLEMIPPDQDPVDGRDPIGGRDPIDGQNSEDVNRIPDAALSDAALSDADGAATGNRVPLDAQPSLSDVVPPNSDGLSATDVPVPSNAAESPSSQPGPEVAPEAPMQSMVPDGTDAAESPADATGASSDLPGNGGAGADTDDSEPEAPGSPFVLSQAAPTLLIAAQTSVDQVSPANPEQAVLAAAESPLRWNRIAGDAPVPVDRVLVVPPSLEATVRLGEGVELMAIGPVEFRLSIDGDDLPAVGLEFGRLVINADADSSPILVDDGVTRVRMDWSEGDAAVALAKTYHREPGADLLTSPRRIDTLALVIDGAVRYQWMSDATADQNDLPPSGTVDGGSGWTATAVVEGSSNDAGSSNDGGASNDAGASNIAMQSLVRLTREPPAWAQTDGPRRSPMEVLSRDGLLEQIDADKPLEMSLREATSFRREEVAALAGETLLMLGRGEVFFGVDGLLSKESQRSFWEEHFRTLSAMLDRDPSVAARILDDIRRMDAAGEPTIRTLLTGYSQQDLIDGGDAELVEALDSPSMPIRVLAIENLSAITGKRLFYRAEHKTEAKRSAAIKKWRALVRKEQIRWPGDAADVR